MIEAEKGWHDVECPHCGAYLDVEDSDDFASERNMERDQDYTMTCPVCDGRTTVHVFWEPTYPYGAKAVER